MRNGASSSLAATSCALTVGRIQFSGGSLAYTVAGSGPPLLLVHGLGGSRQTWRHLLPLLATQNTVIAVDLPGHGESDAPAGDYSLGAHAAALRDVLVALGHSRASIVGHSLGGGIALQFAYQFPERTERLLLISSGGLGKEVTLVLRAATLPGAETVVAALGRLPLGVSRMALLAMPGLVARQDVRLFADDLRTFSSTKQCRTFVRTARSVIDWRGQSVSATHQTQFLNALPVFLAWGDNDKTIPPSHHRDLADHLPNARTLEIHGAGHYPHETAPGMLVPAMREFLRKSEPYEYSEFHWRALLTPHMQEVISSPRLDTPGTN